MADSSEDSSVCSLPVWPWGPTVDVFMIEDLERFAQCPLSYRLHCVERMPAEMAQERHFAAVLHRALEEVVQVQLRERLGGPLSVDYALELYRLAWRDSPLVDQRLFLEGRELVQLWIEREGDVDASRVVGADVPFTVRVGDFSVDGKIDRVDCVGDKGILIRDYTSTRTPPRREDVEESFRLAVYDLAARTMWPWATRVEVAFDLLRHGIVMRTERTDAQREATRESILATAAQIREGRAFAKPSTRCTSCDHRSQCSAYADMSTGKREYAGATPNDLPAVSREREELAAVIKALTVRKGTLDDILRAELEHQPELVLGGHRYWLEVAHYLEYPFEPTIALLAGIGVAREEAVARLATIDNSALRQLLQSLRKQTPTRQRMSIEDRLEAMACVSPVTRLMVREVKS